MSRDGGYPIVLVDELLEVDVERRVPSAERLVDALAYLTPPANTYRQLADLVSTVPPSHDPHVTETD